MQALPEVHRTYLDAAMTTARLIEQIPADSWARPALGEWDVRALVGHTAHAALSTVGTYLARPAEREDLVSAAAYYALPPSRTGEGDGAAAVAERGRQAGDDLGPDPSSAFRRLVDRVAARLEERRPDDLVQTPAGGIRVDSYLPSRTVELVVHGFDIAAAVQLPVEFGAPVIADAVTVLARTGAELGRGPELLRALTGRSALQVGFTVV